MGYNGITGVPNQHIYKIHRESPHGQAKPDEVGMG